MSKFVLNFAILVMLVSNVTFTYANKAQIDDLKEVYLAHAQAVQKTDLKKMRLYMTKESASSLSEGLDKWNSKKPGSLLNTLKVSLPKEPMFGNQVIDGEKAILRLEGSGGLFPPNELSRVKDRLIYGTIYFKKEEGHWKIDKQSFTSYKDPTPLLPEDKSQPITFFMTPQFHANHTSNPSQCEDEKTWRGACYASWAVLNLDVSLCDKIPDEKGVSSVDRLRCFENLASLTGDISLCKKATNDPFLLIV